MRTIVIGGGISGLACAYRLREQGIPVLLLEKVQRIGGVIESIRKDGFLFDLGPQSFSPTELLSELIAALGLKANLLEADARAARYILVRGQLVSAPLAPPALLTTSLLGPRSKWRLLSEPMRRSRPPEGDESVADFVRRKFGEEVLERLVGPFVSGVYAGDPEELSLRSAFPAAYRWEKEYGSVIRGAMKSPPGGEKRRRTLCSFPGGMDTLVRALGEKLGEAVECGVSVISVSRGKTNGASQFELQVDVQGRREHLSADVVIVATPAYLAGRILRGVSPSFADPLARITYAPVVVVPAGYCREQVAHPLRGFGFLVPRGEGLRLLGTIWNSSLFPGRAPEGKVVLTSFAGGATDREFCQLDDAQLADRIGQELTGILGISGAPVARLVHKHANALPQYNLGHGKITAALRELVGRVPGLFLTGNYLEGPALGACIEQGFETAHSVQRYLACRDEGGLPREPDRNIILGRQGGRG
ncbi:MAG TPA: protoporphyrinogen oxidase [Candidatus Acidoferrales bacterium]|nr:protoporphyrinogen oxidase [Candidatus Acidoferrales bacterium]